MNKKFVLTSDMLDKYSLAHTYFEVATMQEMQDFEIDEQAQIQEIIESAILFYIESAINQSLQDIGSLTMKLEQ